MMLYAIIGEDGPQGSLKRPGLRAAHLRRLEALRDCGRLVLAGPMPAIDSPDPGPAGFHGSIVVAEFENLETAQAWAGEEPYLTGGVFETIVVRPFRQVMP
jgi:uncharacterized protein YciI